MKKFSKVFKSLEEVTYASQLFKSRPDQMNAMITSTVNKLNHCIEMLDKNDSLDINDEFIERLTWAELIGTLIEARARLKVYEEREKNEDAA